MENYGKPIPDEHSKGYLRMLGETLEFLNLIAVPKDVLRKLNDMDNVELLTGLTHIGLEFCRSKQSFPQEGKSIAAATINEVLNRIKDGRING